MTLKTCKLIQLPNNDAPLHVVRHPYSAPSQDHDMINAILAKKVDGKGKALNQSWHCVHSRIYASFAKFKANMPNEEFKVRRSLGISYGKRVGRFEGKDID